MREQFSLQHVQVDGGEDADVMGRHSSGLYEKEIHVNMCTYNSELLER
jgi:hypothetical protein